MFWLSYTVFCGLLYAFAQGLLIYKQQPSVRLVAWGALKGLVVGLAWPLLIPTLIIIVIRDILYESV